jgi:prolyl oligopeptidase
MGALGHDYFYYENIEGGHGGTANQEQLAHRIALEYAYFARQLMGEPGTSAPAASLPAPPPATPRP